MSTETQKLKTKINKLIDEVNQLDEDILKKKELLKALKEEIKMLQIRENVSGAEAFDLKDQDKNEMMEFMSDFCLIAKIIFEKKDYIPYSYTTQNSEYFYKIEKSVLDDYIDNYAKTDIKTFLNYCILLALIKSEPNKKCTYSSGKVTVYYVSRVFMEAAAGKELLEGEV